ncbi:sporulation integral membrane protein YtvI [Lachnoclostridium sp. Marseille-P6806]|uniref:sporulation integral membrane protein YtvI n=1 Tax=Lachnoclostridium sp. Marseille-P6806 TaxID=2364793 RepID=UPI0010323C3C|nr:sporulation integral membrane protein YtvI [Lachnoclostridium sp. Marseille-P6806]
MQIEKMHAFIIRILFYCIILGLAYAVLKYALPLLMPFLVAFLIAFILKPVINRVTQRTKLGRKPVSVLLLIAFYVLAAALIAVLGTRLVIFFRDIFYAMPQVYDTAVAPALNSLQDTLENWVLALNPTLTDVVESTGNNLSSSLSSMVTAISAGALSAATNVAGSVPSFLIKFIITIVASFFFVADYYTITSFLARQLPPKARDMLFKAKEKGVVVIFQFGRAYAILLSITFVELLIGFSLLRVDYALLIALLTAILDILPVVGTGTVLLPWAAGMLILGNFPLGIGLLILYAVITVVRQTLEPRVVGKQIGLYPLVTLVCMFVGTYLFGFVGLFGLPIIATILVQLNRSGDIQLFK